MRIPTAQLVQLAIGALLIGQLGARPGRDYQRAAEADFARHPNAGGSLKVGGVSSWIPRVRYHIDVHIEDGFARTTVDQVYFNTQHRQVEGRYEFPLPGGASISRLAMDVRGEIMEGGMVERRRAANIYNEILSTRRDPVLLEWVDGRTFSMRVFPIEPREHKRIILSYTQRLELEGGQWRYHFPGADGQVAGEWSASVRVAGARGADWQCQTHHFEAHDEGRDLVLEASSEGVSPAGDLILRIDTGGRDEPAPRAVVMEKDGARYAMLRWRPAAAPGDPGERQERRWVVVFEASADRDPVFVRQQIEALRELVSARPGDEFRIVVANTQARLLPITELENVHLIGALDLGLAFEVAGAHLKGHDRSVLLHLGGAWASLGPRDAASLRRALPGAVQYIGAGFGNEVDSPLMEELATATGGVSGVVADGRDLQKLLRGPGGADGLDVQVLAPDQPELRFLVDLDAAARGGEVFAVARLGADERLPTKLLVREDFGRGASQRELETEWAEEPAGYLPRLWGRLEIDRLVAAGGDAERERVIGISQQLYVLSPFTSLLVLEDAKMHAQYGVERGRDDHWAMYPVRPFDRPPPVPKLPDDEPGGSGRGTEIEFPKPIFCGTPVPLGHVPNLEKPGRRYGTHAAGPRHWRPTFAGEAVRLKQVWTSHRRSFGWPRRTLDAPIGSRVLSLGAPVSSSDPEPIIGELDMITDGDKDGVDGSYVELGPHRQWVQIDLGEDRELWGIVVWHYHKNVRVYNDVVVQISSDPDFREGVHTVFNNDHDNSSRLGVGGDKNYVETNHARIIDVPGTRARYVRLYSNGNSSNEMNHYVEVEVWGRDAGPATARDLQRPADHWAMLAQDERELEKQWQAQLADGGVELRWLRQSHARVLQRMSEALDEGGAPPEDFSADRIVRLADRWWGVDAGSPDACYLAAALLGKLGREDLRWAYLTTPVAMARGSGEAWRKLAAHPQAAAEPSLRAAILRAAEGAE